MANKPPLLQLPLLPNPPANQIDANFRNNVINELGGHFVPQCDAMLLQQSIINANVAKLNLNMRKGNMPVEDGMWQNEHNQVENINRYGGPIRNVNFHGTDVSSAMTGNDNGCAQLNWEPYRNEGFRGQWFPYEGEQQHVGRERSQPYARRANWR